MSKVEALEDRTFLSVASQDIDSDTAIVRGEIHEDHDEQEDSREHEDEVEGEEDEEDEEHEEDEEDEEDEVDREDDESEDVHDEHEEEDEDDNHEEEDESPRVQSGTSSPGDDGTKGENPEPETPQTGSGFANSASVPGDSDAPSQQADSTSIIEVVEGASAGAVSTFGESATVSIATTLFAELGAVFSNGPAMEMPRGDSVRDATVFLDARATSEVPSDVLSAQRIDAEPRVYRIAGFGDPLTLMSDALATVTQELSQISKLTEGEFRTQAWLASATILSLDVAMLAYYGARTRPKRRGLS